MCMLNIVDNNKKLILWSYVLCCQIDHTVYMATHQGLLIKLILKLTEIKFK